MHANPVGADQRIASALTLTLGNCSLRCSTSRIPAVVSQGERGFLRERGTALIFALVMLLLLTLLGITAVTTSSLQEKMAGNMRDQHMAQQAGDSILRDGQSWVFNQTDKPTPSCQPGAGPSGGIWDSSCLPADAGATGANWWLPPAATDSWWSGNGIASSETHPTSQEPRFVVERIQQAPITAEIGKSKKVYRFYYRTTGWSVGATDSSRGLIQDVFSKRSDTYTN